MALDERVVYYDPRRVLDYIEVRGQIAPSDLAELGYDRKAASDILVQLWIGKYVRGAGMKTVNPRAYFRNETGEVKRASVTEVEQSFRLSDKGRKEKPEAWQMWSMCSVRLDDMQSTDLYQSAAPEDKEKLDKLLKGLFTDVERQLPAAMKDITERAVKHVKAEDEEAKILYGKEKA
jgi:hypothetical protein